jgi:hypothetical protein
MTMIIDGTNGLTFNNATTQNSGGKVIQVAQTFFPSTFSTTSSSFTDVTGLSLAITPQFNTSKLLVFVNLYGSNSVNTGATLFSLNRNGSSVGGGTASGSRPSAIGMGSIPYNSQVYCTSISYLDSPATTSAVTYQVQIKTQSGNTAALGYATGESNDANYGRFPATITVLEIAG